MKSRLPLPLLVSIFFPSGLLAARKLVRFNMTKYSSKLNWKDAQSFCRSSHTDMVSIRNQQEAVDFLMADGWIGLRREDVNSQWKWSMGDERANYFNWKDDIEENNCVAKMAKQSNWFTSDCENLHNFTCVDEMLVLVKEDKTWEEALEHCRSLKARNGASGEEDHLYDLVSMVSDEDHKVVRDKVHEATTEEVWTGLRFLAGRWYWVDGRKMEYEEIEDCPGVELCGVLEKSGTAAYKTRDCNERRNFVCSMKQNSKMFHHIINGLFNQYGTT